MGQMLAISHILENTNIFGNNFTKVAITKKSNNNYELIILGAENCLGYLDEVFNIIP
jgi:hypothetical protein